MKIYKSIAAAAALALACTSFTVPAFAADETEAVPAKDETVYVIENTDGSAEKVIVSDIFSNVSAEDAVKYTAGLTDAQEITENNWQGTTDKELPVQISITYTLDGEEIAPEELAGKSGHVVIRFNYTNTEMKDGLYVPFAVLTGTYLDNDNFTNVEVTNGTSINDGDRTIVAGLAFPGLNENLSSALNTMKSDMAEKLPDNSDDINSVDVTLPDYVEISADTTDFQLSTALTLVSGLSSISDVSDNIGEIDLSGFDDSLSQLKDDMTQLSDGSSELASGLETLLSSCNDLSDGVSQLSEGLTTLTANNETLVSGAETVYNTLLSTAASQLTAAGLEVPELTIDNYSSVLDSVLETLSDPTAYAEAQARTQVEEAVNAKESDIRTAVTEAVKAEVETKVTEAVKAEVETKVTEAVKAEVETKVTEAVKAEVETKVTEAVKAEVESKVTEAVKTEVEAKVTEAVKAEVWSQILASQGLDASNYDAAVAGGLVTEEQQTALNTALEQQMASDEVKATISTNTDQQMASDDIKSTIQTNIDQQMASDDIKSTIQTNIDQQMASDDIKSTIQTNIDQQMASDDIKSTIQTNIDQQMASDDIASTIDSNVQEQTKSLIEENLNSDDVKAQIAAGAESAAAGAESIKTLKTQLESYNEFYTGLKTYTEGVASASEGASTINNSMPDLIDGVTKLHDGAATLSDALTELKSFADSADTDLTNIKDVIEKSADLGKEYTSFTDNPDNINSKVKFIYRTDSIE